MLLSKVIVMCFLTFVFVATLAEENYKRPKRLVHPTIPLLYKMYKVGLFSREKLCQFIDEIKIQWVGKMRVERLPIFRLEMLVGISNYEYNNNINCTVFDIKDIEIPNIE
jgi:hypothetical protein